MAFRPPTLCRPAHEPKFEPTERNLERVSLVGFFSVGRPLFWRPSIIIEPNYLWAFTRRARDVSGPIEPCRSTSLSAPLDQLPLLIILCNLVNAGKTAADTISVMLAVFARIQPALRKSITFDNDTAFAQHALLRTMRAMTTWFCKPMPRGKRAGSKTQTADYDAGCPVRSTSTNCPTRKSRTSSSPPSSRPENAWASRPLSRQSSKSLAKTCKSALHGPLNLAPESRRVSAQTKEANAINSSGLDPYCRLPRAGCGRLRRCSRGEVQESGVRK